MDELPLAVRRTRRSTTRAASPARDGSSDSRPTLAKTPRRGTGRKHVRLSDPGPHASSGLTPMIRRIAVNTPRRRHSSAPITSASKNSINNGSLFPASPGGLPQSGEVNFLPLRQVLDGRVQRRLRRNGLSEEMNTIQQERRRRAQESKAEIDRLKAELKARDREIYEFQNATIVMDTERVWELEKQVEALKGELTKRSGVESDRRGLSWALSPREPYGDDDFMDLMPDEDNFGEETMAQLACSTPSRARSSFPTPPATSPMIPTAPCSPVSRSMPQSHTGVQVCIANPATKKLEDEVASLQLEISKLSNTLESYKTLSTRLEDKVTQCESECNSSSDASANDLESRVGLLIQTMSDRTCALAQLTTAITDLGFSGSDAAEMMTSLSSGFRAARLELEYLTPGEITLPLSSHGAEVLDLLLTRLRTLAKKSKEDETSIDEYHEIEQSLRKQLDARVSVMDGLKAEMGKAEQLMADKMARIRELEVANVRLKGAVDGYARDMAELEALAQRLEQEGRDSRATQHAQAEAGRRVLRGKEDAIAQLEAKLAHTLQRSAGLLEQLSAAQEDRTKEAAALNRKHGANLAVRDARVAELRGEVDRVNESLRAAHETICRLRVDNGGLQAQLSEERDKAKGVIDSMKDELQRALQMSHDFLNTPKKGEAADKAEAEAAAPTVVRRSGGLFAGRLARRGSKNMAGDRDSGMGLLDEDEVEMF